jgi:exonuclease III
MTACLINCQSVGNKALTIKDYIVENDLDVAFLCETWLTSSRQRICGELTPTGYRLRTLNRKEKRGGGVAVLHKESVKVGEVEDFSTDSMEVLAFTLMSQKNIRILLLYRPPPKNDIPRRAFLNDLHDILDRLALSTRPFIIIGDFNIHWDVAAARERAILHDLCGGRYS